MRIEDGRGEGVIINSSLSQLKVTSATLPFTITSRSLVRNAMQQH